MPNSYADSDYIARQVIRVQGAHTMFRTARRVDGGVEKEQPDELVYGGLPVLKLAGHVNTFTHLFDQRFMPDCLEGENREAFAPYLRTFVDLGTHHIQFNIVDNKLLLDAQQHPENYSDLTVRVAG